MKPAYTLVTDDSSPILETAISTQNTQPVEITCKQVNHEADPAAADSGREQQPSLERLVADFVAKVSDRFRERMKRRPKAIKKRILSLLDLQLPPHPRRAGRRPQSRITKATQLYQQQLREMKAGTRTAANWLSIARVC